VTREAAGADLLTAVNGSGVAAPLARRRPAFRRRALHGAAPYLLLAPAAVVIAGVLAYPLYKLVALSFQKYGLFELVRHQGKWIGFANYSHIFHDSLFWHVVLRTIVFAAVNVALTMVLGTLIALLLERLGRTMRVLLTTGLVCVWAIPVVVAVAVFQWMVDFQFGVVNWLLTQLHLADYQHHNWFTNPLQGFAVITALIVWGAIPFVSITIYAGLAQLPRELVEAAEVDGANAWRVFWNITLPVLKPIFVILVSLSIIWDFQVFIQVWLMLGTTPSEDYYLMSVYSFVQSFKISEYGLGSAIAVVMVLMMLSVTFVYVRQMVRIGEAD
jgi:N,N'-diacetylchitobiose transport system permease protein